jgi:hypothetical protein
MAVLESKSNCQVGVIGSFCPKFKKEMVVFDLEPGDYALHYR